MGGPAGDLFIGNRKFKIDPKTPATSATTATFQPKCSKSSNRSNPLGMDSGLSNNLFSANSNWCLGLVTSI